MESGGGRTDNLPNCMATIEGALGLSANLNSDIPTLLAGHSFGGRMSSHFAAKYTDDPRVAGLIYFSFPLHPSGKPDIKRANHLPDIQVPQLFLSGDRDKLAELELLTPVIERLDLARLHLIETADHSFKILKRTRESSEDVYAEAARIASDFVEKIV
jgi:predicted alpha/beta-hydrolase family hydrolase